MNMSQQLRIFQISVVFAVLLYVISIIADNYLISMIRALPTDLWSTVSPLWKLGSYFTTSLLFVLGYSIFYNGIPGRGLHKGLQYGFWIWIIGSVPVFLTVLATVELPVELVIAWIIIGLFTSCFFGLLVGFLLKLGKK